jgi:cell fate regulator YaaT (PSP1 superfamily)
MKDQSKPLEAPIMDLIERQLEEDLEVLNEDFKKKNDEIHAYNAKVNKQYLDIAKIIGRKLEKKINKPDSE